MRRSFLLVFFFLFLTGLEAEPRLVKVGAFNYFPGIFRDNDGVVRGFIVDMLTSMARIEGWQVEYVFGTWTEGLERVRTGQIDLLTAVAYTKERDEYLDYGRVPIMTVWSQVFVRHESDIDGILDLNKKKIAVMKNDFNGAAFKALARNFRVDCSFVEQDDFSGALQAVSEGRADAGVVNSVFGISKTSDYKVKATDIVFNPFDIHFAVAEGKNSDLRVALDRLQEVDQHGEHSLFAEMIKRWTHGTINRVTILPDWLINVGSILLAVLALSALFIVVLRLRVRTVTANFKVLLDSMTDGLIVHDPLDGRILLANKRALTMYGYSINELKACSIEDLSVPEEGFTQSVAINHVQAAAQGFSQQFEWRAKSRKGDQFWVEVNMGSARIDGKLRILVLVRNIEERIQAQRVSQRAQSLESIGILAGGLAHDFNNLLSGVFGYIELASLTYHQGNPEKGAVYLEKAKSVFKRAQSLTRQLLTFAKGGQPTRSPQDVPKLVHDAIDFALSGSNVFLQWYQESPEMVSSVDPHQIAQVFENLAINAKQAMHHGGVLSVGITRKVVSEGTTLPLPVGDYLLIKVLDQGTGIPPDALSRIFDPFYTTKVDGHGLGLSMCWSIISQHGGHMDVKSQVGRGTLINVWIPSNSIFDVPEVLSNIDSSSSLVVTSRVLVMDDEEFNGEIMSSLLERRGYQVVVTHDCASAVRAYDDAIRERNPISLCFLDLTVPGGEGGLCAADAIREIDPGARLVVMSGYSDEPAMSNPVAFGFVERLQKPFQASELEKVLNRVLSR